MKSYVIFAIDNDNDLHNVSKFMRHVDTQKAMGKMKGTMKPCIGSYKGQLENSYIMCVEDFTAHVNRSGYVKNQESFLFLEEGHRGVTYGSLVFNSFSKPPQSLGIMRAVSKDKAMSYDAWTYRPELDTYYICA